MKGREKNLIPMRFASGLQVSQTHETVADKWHFWDTRTVKIQCEVVFWLLNPAGAVEDHARKRVMCKHHLQDRDLCKEIGVFLHSPQSSKAWVFKLWPVGQIWGIAVTKPYHSTPQTSFLHLISAAICARQALLLHIVQRGSVPPFLTALWKLMQRLSMEKGGCEAEQQGYLVLQGAPVWIQLSASPSPCTSSGGKGSSLPQLQRPCLSVPLSVSSAGFRLSSRGDNKSLLVSWKKLIIFIALGSVLLEGRRDWISSQLQRVGEGVHLYPQFQKTMRGSRTELSWITGERWARVWRFLNQGKLPSNYI